MDNRIDPLYEPDDSEQDPKPEEGFHADESREKPEENAFEEPRPEADKPEKKDYAEFEPEAPGVPEENAYTESHAETVVEPEVEKVPDKDDKLWATICHLSALIGYLGVPFGNIIGPLIIWLIKKEDSAFVDANGKKALNFHISLTIYGLAATPLICLGPLILLVVIPLMIIGVIFPIIAAVKANNGEEYNYPISIEFIK